MLKPQRPCPMSVSARQRDPGYPRLRRQRAAVLRLLVGAVKTTSLLFLLSGCELIVDFDRSKIDDMAPPVDNATPDAGADASVDDDDAGSEGGSGDGSDDDAGS